MLAEWQIRRGNAHPQKGRPHQGVLNGAINVRAEAELGHCVQVMRAQIRGFALDDGVRRRAKCCRARKKRPCLGQSMNFSSARTGSFDLHFGLFRTPAPTP